MDPATQLAQLLDVATACSEAEAPDQALKAALAPLLSLSGAASVLVLRPDAGGVSSEVRDGEELDATALGELGVPDEPGLLVGCPVPSSWAAQGIGRIATQRLPGHLGVLVLAWTDARPGDSSDPTLRMALGHLEAALGRSQAQEDLSDLVARVDNAQMLANMGDYDWHIPSDTNRWSDQLYRIYGHEPQSFNASYERFLSLIHPEDRERITAVHQQAYGTGEPYQMIERIVRPDGEVRFLASNGQVLMDRSGTPERMRGTCIDITDRVLAEQAREVTAERFRGLVEFAPDAILVLDEDSRIVEANPKAAELLGGSPVGHRIHEILPLGASEGGNGLEALGVDGRGLVLDVTTVAVEHVDAERTVALFLRSAELRLAGEALAARLGEAQLRRQQALEINDNVVQGLVAAAYALELEEFTKTSTYLAGTLASARAMMDDLLEPLRGGELAPGDLVRTVPAEIGALQTAQPPAHPGGETVHSAHRVLVVDDAEDLRTMLRLRMESVEELVVVGEAGDGVAAVDRASELQPDLVFLDLSMPRMDGLEALPLIRAAVPGVRVIVLSGFNEGGMAERAIEAGADHYVVKGGSIRELIQLAVRTLQSR